MQGAIGQVSQRVGKLFGSHLTARQDRLAYSNIRHNSFKEILDKSVNVVHLRREGIGPPEDLEALLAESHWGFRTQAKVPVSRPKPIVSTLFVGFDKIGGKKQTEWLQGDIVRLCQDFAAVHMPEDGLLNVKLEHVLNTPCSKWHADHVALRLLTTYWGPGTLYIPDRYVTRFVEDDGHPVVQVDGRDESHAIGAQPGDLLLLKGHSWPGNTGLGAVHKSPTMEFCDCGAEHNAFESTRLVLTIDTATDW